MNTVLILYQIHMFSYTSYKISFVFTAAIQSKFSKMLTLILGVQSLSVELLSVGSR